jgi:spore coat protein U-like protein
VRRRPDPHFAGLVLAVCMLAGSGRASAACTIWAGALVLGNYDPSTPAVVVQGYDIELRCDAGELQFELALGPSATSGSVEARAMQHAFRPAILRYNLYQDAAATRLWTDRGAGMLVGATLRGRAVVSVHARIEPLQDAWVGDYHDDVVLTVLP